MSKKRYEIVSYDIPLWLKPVLSVTETSIYTGISANKIYEMSESEDCPFVIWIGSRRVIKRKSFEEYLETVVNMSTYTDNYVNPLEMDVWSLDPNDSKGMVREKVEFMLGLCEQCIGDSLNSRQKSIIDRCVRKLYIDIVMSKEKYIPVMRDFTIFLWCSRRKQRILHYHWSFL